MEQTVVSVLVVEDDPAHARLLCENLRTPGYGLSFTFTGTDDKAVSQVHGGAVALYNNGQSPGLTAE